MHVRQWILRSGAGVALAMAALVTAASVATTQPPNPATKPANQDSGDGLKRYLTHLVDDYTKTDTSVASAMRLSRFSLQHIDALIARATLAAEQGQFRVAADDVALAAVAVPSFVRRDTLQQVLRTLLQHERGGAPRAALLDSLVAQRLDRAFSAVYDTWIPVTKAPPATSGRVVLAEYITGTQCAPCYFHDRLYAGVLQRYPARNVVVLAYHGSPGYPIAYGGDSLWPALGILGFNPPGPDHTGIYEGCLTLWCAGDLGEVDGKRAVAWGDEMHLVNGEADSAVMAHKMAVMQAPNIAAAMYAAMTPYIDSALQQPPSAKIAMTITPMGATKTQLKAARVRVRVTPLDRRTHLGVRLVLVEDTVRVTGFTNRRLQYAAVRTVAWFGHPRSLFAPLPADRTAPTTVNYTFDIAALQRALWRTAASDNDGAHAAFPDLQDWRMQPRRLSIVAIVQDMDTKEVLQTAIQRILPPAP